MKALTVEQVQKALPANLKKNATQELVDMLNTIAAEPEAAEAIRENFITYSKVLSEGKFRTEDYINAVKFVSYKLMNYSNKEAYIRAFPDRHQALLARGADEQEISAYVSMYAKGKLVNLILEQTLVPHWVLNQDAYQKAINTQVYLMANAKSEMVQTQAANSILTHLAKPKEVAPLVNINVKEHTGLTDLKDQILLLAQRQRELIEQGVSTKEIASQALVEAEVVEDGEDNDS